MLFCDIWAIWFSRKLELKYRYMNIITAILQPPCWCYGGDSFMQKDRKSKSSKHMFFCFAIFWAVWFSHNLELKYRYINIITANLQPPCWCYGGDSFMQKDSKSKISVPMFFCLALFWVIISIYLYLSSRLRENQTAQNNVKQKNMGTLFFDLLSFCMKESPP